MVSIVIVRHGETDFNKNRQLMGHNSTPLNSKGFDQARKLGKYLHTNYEFKKIYSSDLKRTIQTSNEISKFFRNCEVTYLNEFRERKIATELIGNSYGEFESKTRDENGRIDIFRKIGDGESPVEFYRRVKQGMQKVFEEISKFDFTDKILIITHGGTIRLLMGYLFIDLLENKESEYNYFPTEINNCSITELEYLSNMNSGIYNSEIILKFLNFYQYLDY